MISNLPSNQCVQLSGIPQGTTRTITNVGTTTIYYGRNSQVSASNNVGSLAPGASVTLGFAPFLISVTGQGEIDDEVQSLVAEQDPQTGAISLNELPLSVGNGSLSPFTAIEVAGHSYAVGNYATNNHGFAQKLAQILGLPLTNRAIGGAVAVSDQQVAVGNGWAKVLQDLPRSAGTAPYLPASSLFVVDFGINDLGQVGPGNAAMVQFKSALRTILSRIRAAATGVFEESHASVAFGGTWGGIFAGTTGNSGAGFAYSNTTNTTFTLTVPADFPGGTIAIGYVVAQSGAGALYSISVDGGAAQTYDSRPTSVTISGKSNAMGAVQRITGLSPGAHTIVGTLTAITGTNGGTFDYWQIEAPEPPTILLMTQPRPPAAAYSAYSTWPFTPTDGSVGQLNMAIRQVAAEFDSRVIVVETDTLLGANAANFATGSSLNQLHPNDAGHSLLAAKCLQAVQANGLWLPTLAVSS